MLVALVLSCVAGCGRDTTLHPVTGKVTLGGMPYERLLVYFRPIDKPADEFTMGVGETDPAGVLTLRSTAGNGLVAGKYRVTFSCPTLSVNGREVNVSTDKKEENPAAKIIERVPLQFTEWEQSTVEFEIVAGKPNHFEYDIPLSQ
jgi:hypothetical protein